MIPNEICNMIMENAKIEDAYVLTFCNSVLYKFNNSIKIKLYEELDSKYGIGYMNACLKNERMKGPKYSKDGKTLLTKQLSEWSIDMKILQLRRLHILYIKKVDSNYHKCKWWGERLVILQLEIGEEIVYSGMKNYEHFKTFNQAMKFIENKEREYQRSEKKMEKHLQKKMKRRQEKKLKRGY